MAAKPTSKEVEEASDAEVLGTKAFLVRNLIPLTVVALLASVVVGSLAYVSTRVASSESEYTLREPTTVRNVIDVRRSLGMADVAVEVAEEVVEVAEEVVEVADTAEAPTKVADDADEASAITEEHDKQFEYRDSCTVFVRELRVEAIIVAKHRECDLMEVPSLGRDVVCDTSGKCTDLIL